MVFSFEHLLYFLTLLKYNSFHFIYISFHIFVISQHFKIVRELSLKSHYFIHEKGIKIKNDCKKPNLSKIRNFERLFGFFLDFSEIVICKQLRFFALRSVYQGAPFGPSKSILGRENKL